MRLFRRKERPLSQPVKVRRPLFERLQEWVIKLDVSRSVRWFRLGLFVLVVALVVLYYTGTQFFGLRDPEVMNAAQLGRNLARGRGYVTQVLRPLDLWYLNALGRLNLKGPQPAVPELWTPPVYPAVLAAAWRVMPMRVDLRLARQKLKIGSQLPQDWPVLESLFDAGRGQTLAMDRVIVIVSWIFFLLGLVLVYAMARDLFDHQVAVLAAFLYLFCDPLLHGTVAGRDCGLLALLFMIAAYALLKADRWQLQRKGKGWINAALAVSALAVGLGTLTEYVFAAVFGPLLVFAAVSLGSRRRWWQRVGLCVVVGALVVLPWAVRNWRVSRTAFGFWKVAVYEGVRPSAETVVKPGQLQRGFGLAEVMRLRPVVRKTLQNLRQLYETQFKSIGASYLVVFFLASLLHRFRREEVLRLRRFVFWSMVAAVGWIGVAGPPTAASLTMFLPLIIIYSVAFFYVLFERLQFRTRLVRRGMIGLFVLVNVLPFVFTVLPPWQRPPYPPYDGGITSVVGSAFREDDVLASDIPWAMAWYGDHATVWMPYDEQDFKTINDDVHVIAGIYLTQESVLEQEPLEIAAGRHVFWQRLYVGSVPDFPLRVQRHVSPDFQQVLVSDRVR